MVQRDNPELPPGERLHDDLVYLVENRADEPKEIFKVLRDILAADPVSGEEQVDMLDVGCATGEFIQYLRSQFPDWTYFGLDVSEKLIEESRRRLPKVNFTCGSLLDSSCFNDRKFDVITCLGVLSIFDSLEQPLSNLIDGLSDNGTLLVFGMMNEFAVDLLVRCRYSDKPNQPWQSGFNAFSREYYAHVLRAHDRSLNWSWTRFRMPFAMPRKDDLLRNWIIRTEQDPFQQMRGTGQLSPQFILQVKSG